MELAKKPAAPPVEATAEVMATAGLFEKRVSSGHYSEKFAQAAIDLSAMRGQGSPRAPAKIVVANKKGGVAKTTTAMHLAFQLSKYGFKVLLVDLDPDNAATRIVVSESDIRAAAKSRSTVYEWLLNKRPFEDVVKEVRPGWDIVPSAKLPKEDPPYNGIKDFVNLERYGKDGLLLTRLSKLDHYDFVLVDTPAGNGVEPIHSLAMLAADCVCVACPAEGPDVGSTHDIVQQLEELESLELIQIVVTRYKKQVHNIVQLEQLQEEYPQYLNPVIIHERSQVGQDNLGLSSDSKSIPEYEDLAKDLALKLWLSKID